jgi:hypothetical protein
MRSKTIGTLSCVAAVLALGLAPAAASAASSSQIVSGTSLGLLAIAAVPAATFTTGFEAGSTATTTGLITMTDTDPSWSLSVHDDATADPGHMVAAAIGCGGSESSLQNPLSVDVTGLLPGATSAGPVSISGAPQTVSSATNQLLAANIFTANYSQSLGSGESLLAGCVYSLTATYTLQ